MSTHGPCGISGTHPPAAASALCSEDSRCPCRLQARRGMRSGATLLAVAAAVARDEHGAVPRDGCARARGVVPGGRARPRRARGPPLDGLQSRTHGGSGRLVCTSAESRPCCPRTPSQPQRNYQAPPQQPAHGWPSRRLPHYIPNSPQPRATRLQSAVPTEQSHAGYMLPLLCSALAGPPAHLLDRGCGQAAARVGRRHVVHKLHLRLVRVPARRYDRSSARLACARSGREQGVSPSGGAGPRAALACVPAGPASARSVEAQALRRSSAHLPDCLRSHALPAARTQGAAALTRSECAWSRAVRLDTA